MARRENDWRSKYRIWTEYRYGEAKPVSLPPIWSKEKRKSVVSKAMDLMRDWRLSPFEFEGETIAGIRSGLCIAGHGWQRSDRAARDAVGEALRILGAERPTWEQGQPDYVERRETCVWCKSELDSSRSGTGYKYCSVDCAKTAMQKRDFEVRSNSDKAFAAAKMMLARAKVKPQDCERCGKAFHPIPGRVMRFCSNFCSRHSRAPVPESVYACTFCDAAFTSRSKRAFYCSEVCQQASFRAGKGYEFKVLKPNIFDHYWTRHWRTAMRPEMSASLFDQIFESAA